MSTSNETVQAAVDRACANFEATLKDLGVSLTFDISDVPKLEEVLLAVRDAGDESATSGACFMAGAYMGEILRRALGGQWLMSADGVATLQLSGDRERLHPVEKVRKFIRNPAGEGLAFYSQAILSRRELDRSSPDTE